VADAPERTTEESPVASQRRLKDILISTLLVGGGSIINILTGVARGKVISVIIGPAGIGLQGLLQSTLRTVSTIAGMGLGTSGVREVAKLRGEGDTAELGHTLRGLRRATLALGALAAVVLLVLHRPLAGLLLDDENLGWALAVLAIGVMAQVSYATYDAFLRGSRRVAVVTKASVVGNLLAAATAVALVSMIGVEGIAWALVAQPVCVLAIALVVARDFRAHLVPVDRERTRAAMSRLVRAGAVLATTGFVSTGAQLAARVLIAHSTTLDDVGYYQAAWAVSVLYLGFVLGAMSVDYYPRLAELGKDRAGLANGVNEQTKVALLLAGPAILGVLTLSSQVIALLYSSKFGPAADLLRWQLLGDVVKIGGSTLGYLVLAQGNTRVFFFVELSWSSVYLVVLAALLPAMGIDAAAVAYVVASVAYFVVLCFVARRMVGFVWSRSNVVLMAMIGVLAGVVLASHLLLSFWVGLGVGGLTCVAFGVYCLVRLVREAGITQLRRRRKA
jgi:enterobacterial common antigen flippase